MSATENDELDLPTAADDAVSTGAAADSADWDERLKGLPRLLRYAMLIIDKAGHIEQRLIAEIDELCPRLAQNATWAATLFPERHRSLIEQHLQDEHAQSNWYWDIAIRPDKARIRIARLAADFFGGQNDLIQSELGERTESFLLGIAHASSRNNVEQELAVVAPYYDGIELYLLGRNRRRRDVSN